jgi:hypothetical protein
MIRVTIEGELFADCLHLLPNRWNGFVVPVFSDEQRQFVLSECVRLGWVEPNDDYDGQPSHLVGWVASDDGTWMVDGWVWDEVGA